MYPRTCREMKNHHMDSTLWNDFRFRSDDVVVATYAKSGTTWVQQIIGQMLLGPDPSLSILKTALWVDLRVPPKDEMLAAAEAQSHRRILKTHLPVDALRMSRDVKYLYIARDGRDVAWSLYNHHAHATPVWYKAMNDTPGRVGPPIAPPPADIRQYFLEWLDGDGFPFWPFWDHIRGWWAIRHLPNVKVLHFSELKRDSGSAMREIAEFLEADVDPADWPAIERFSSFDWMKTHADTVLAQYGAFWDGGAKTFINQGTKGRWQDVLTTDDCAAYEMLAEGKLGRECAAWLAQR